MDVSIAYALCRCEASSVGRPVININKASVSDMVPLYPMGVETADATRMVNFRTENGPFQRVEDLKWSYAKIFSQELYDTVKQYLSVHDPRRCSTDADCAAWDEQSCFSQVSQDTRCIHHHASASVTRCVADMLMGLQ